MQTNAYEGWLGQAFETVWKRKLQHVWLQTQFDSAEFLQSRIGDKKCVSNKLTILFGVSSFLWCPGTSDPTSGVPEATQEASRKPLKGAV